MNAKKWSLMVALGMENKMLRRSGSIALMVAMIGIAIAKSSESYSFYAIDCELDGQKQCSPLADVAVVVNPSTQTVQLNGINFKTTQSFADTLVGCRVPDEKNFVCEERRGSHGTFSSRTFSLAAGKYMTYKVIAYPEVTKTVYFVGAFEYYWRKLIDRWAP